MAAGRGLFVWKKATGLSFGVALGYWACVWDGKKDTLWIQAGVSSLVGLLAVVWDGLGM